MIVYSSMLKTHKIYSPRQPGTRDLCTRDDDDYDGVVVMTTVNAI
jgi:hypothetical protein